VHHGGRSGGGGDAAAGHALRLARLPPRRPSCRGAQHCCLALHAPPGCQGKLPSMHHLAAKVVATNMVLAGEPLTAVHLLCSIGQYADACTQLQAIGRWVDASTLAACHLSGADRAKVLHRWAQHTLNNEHDLWR
ncbi:unnamed protein product, partial [Closterium sp. NIES-54]